MEKLSTIPPKNTKKTREESAIMDQFFPEDGDVEDNGGDSRAPPEEQPSFFQRLDVKKAAMITFIFALLANPWSDSIISKLPYMDNGLVSFGFKGLLFFIVMMAMNAMM